MEDSSFTISDPVRQQVMVAETALNEPVVSHDKWMGYLSDPHFGTELAYIRRRAFLGNDYCQRSANQGAMLKRALLSNGGRPYKALLDESNVAVSVSVLRAGPAILRLVPFSLRVGFAYELLNNRWFLLNREIWLIQPPNSVGPLPLRMMSNGEDGAGESYQIGQPLECLYYSHLAWEGVPKNSGNIVVIVTLGRIFSEHVHSTEFKMNFAIVKPPTDAISLRNDKACQKVTTASAT